MGLMRNMANTYKYFGICGSRLKLSDAHRHIGPAASKKKPFRIYPEETSHSILATTMFAVFVYSVVFFPLCIALGNDFRSDPIQNWCNLGALIFLSLGMVLRLFTVDLVDGKPIEGIYQIVTRYIKSFFFFDFIGSMPFEYIFDIRSELLISAIFLARLARVSLAVFSERKLGKYFQTKMKSIIRSSKMMKVLETLFFTLLILHISSCILLVLSREVPQSSTWLSKYSSLTRFEDPSKHMAASQSNFRRYLLGFYYSTVTITTVGFGDITPGNSYEKAYLCILIVVGVFFYTNSLSLFSTTFIDERFACVTLETGKRPGNTRY